MTNAEKKEWLEWFRAINSKVTMWATETDSLYHDYQGIGCLAYQPIEEEVRLQGTLQLVLQNEIARQGWFFHLRTYNKPEVLIKRVINDEEDFECIATSRASTILEAFMLAFRKAWEAHEIVKEETEKLNTLALMLEEAQHIPPEDYSEWLVSMLRIARKEMI